jgi:hypothetical protein
MPLRYGRKLFFAIALLLPSFQSQLVALLSINISFLVLYLCYKPSKTPLTNYVCLFLEVLLVLMEGVFFSYDKLDSKPVNSQLGFSVCMIILQGLSMLAILAWVVYRLILVIK